MNDNRGLGLLFIVLFGSLGVGYFLGVKSVDPVVEYRIETVEIPKIIVVNNTVYKVIKIPIVEYITVNHTTIHEVLVPTPIPLRDFPDRETLKQFIEYDNTDSFKYSETRWTCMDYTVRVIKNAERLGYRVIFVFIQDDEHAVCMAYCEADAIYYAWEPQTDTKLWVWQSTEAG